MPRCNHKLAPLCPCPDDARASLAFLLCPCPDYLLCSLCGRIGWYTRYARKLSFLRHDDTERVRARAERWNAWFQAHCHEATAQ